MPVYTQKHNRLRNLHPRNTSEFRFPNTSYNSMSSAESELYAICTGTSEGLHLKMFLQESGLASKVNIRIHTDSTAGKSIATRQGTSKKAKHIDIRFLYTQQLTKDGIISIHKINTTRNTADILTKYISRETLQRLLYAAGLHVRT